MNNNERNKFKLKMKNVSSGTSRNILTKSSNKSAEEQNLNFSNRINLMTHSKDFNNILKSKFNVSSIIKEPNNLGSVGHRKKMVGGESLGEIQEMEGLNFPNLNEFKFNKMSNQFGNNLNSDLTSENFYHMRQVNNMNKIKLKKDNVNVDFQDWSGKKKEEIKTHSVSKSKIGI